MINNRCCEEEEEISTENVAEVLLLLRPLRRVAADRVPETGHLAPDIQRDHLGHCAGLFCRPRDFLLPVMA